MAATPGVRSEGDLRAVLGDPSDLVLSKISDRLNPLTRQFIERSPFVCVATKLPDGGIDVSPRGDPAGFVRILDERTLLIPDRPGNRIADTLTNLLHEPAIGLLFLIPGVGDTFRVNGRGAITNDAELLAPSEVEGSPPKLGILVSIQEAYTQCSKALIRSDLWNPDTHIDRSELPSSGEILRSLNDPDFDSAAYDRERAERYARREGLYWGPIIAPADDTSVVELPLSVEGDFDVYVNGILQRDGVDYHLAGRTLVFPRTLTPEQKMTKLQLIRAALGIGGTYHKHDTIDVAYDVGGRKAVATGLQPRRADHASG